MGADSHERFRHMIDETLAGKIPSSQQPSLREHLESCVLCQEYLAASNRVVAALGGFSFEVDPTLNEKVSAMLQRRAQQIQTTQPDRRRWVLSSVLALLLTTVGAFLDLRLSGLIASVFDLQRMHVQQGVIAFWIIPSLCLFLLFPLLPLLSAGGTNRKERNL
jgi:predicted anti-sigma-YlaC factor YlaD